ncbi:ABC transporter permease [Carnobacterium maltaromaticum]|uniref:ABC transporter permease n=1 Tax=Carnobacterium maltaromaticum TaxID=2751 RepID=UPI0039AF31CF
MLLKLSLSGIKSKLKDYIVLLVGLVMSSSIFYMFQTLSMNKDFLKNNSMLSAIAFVFLAGSVLLGIITIVYILYANSFLLSLRQKEYGMYMMLGAKKKKIGKMMFIETLIVGIVSLVIGIIVGIGLSQVVGHLLMQQLEFSSPDYTPFYIPAMNVTAIFFFILFALAAIVNVFKLARFSTLELINGEKQADHIVIRKNKIMIQSFVAFILLLIGYISMINILRFQMLGIFVALVTITGGTFLFFQTFLPYFVQLLKNNRRISEKKINIFTFSQLSFRVNDLTRVLAMVAMLIALAVGSIAVGIGFKNNSELMVEKAAAYDVVIHNPTEKEDKVLDKMDFAKKVNYHYKSDGTMQYFIKEELNENPLFMAENGVLKANEEKFRKVETPLETGTIIKVEEQYNDEWASAFAQIREERIEYGQDLPIKIVSRDEFKQLSGEEHTVLVGNTTGFFDYLPQLKKLNELEKNREPKQEYLSSRYESYSTWNIFSSGTVFMGLFLGFAFLAMMASCLMFKVLSGASNDIKRYEMLSKIGVRCSLLSRSIYVEMFLIFAFPAVIGIIHVLIGMQMFKGFLLAPYYKIWIPFAIFAVIYASYYLITVYLYKGIVLEKAKK